MKHFNLLFQSPLHRDQRYNSMPVLECLKLTFRFNPLFTGISVIT